MTRYIICALAQQFSSSEENMLNWNWMKYNGIRNWVEMGLIGLRAGANVDGFYNPVKKSGKFEAA